MLRYLSSIQSILSHIIYNWGKFSAFSEHNTGDNYSDSKSDYTHISECFILNLFNINKYLKNYL